MMDILYVYFIYGKHFCANVTARKYDTEAGAVLIRSILPLAGQDIMSKMRSYSNNLTIGPGRVTEAMSITQVHNGLDITQETSGISIHRGLDIDDVITSARIGISRATDKPWRYTAARFVSVEVTVYSVNKFLKLQVPGAHLFPGYSAFVALFFGQRASIHRKLFNVKNAQSPMSPLCFL
jgi:DNA-3-methyladenine glycosylase